jgi:hypothetical protein
VRYKVLTAMTKGCCTVRMQKSISVSEDAATSIFSVEKLLVLTGKGGKRENINGRGVR